MNDGGPAFPAHDNWRINSGMSLRDYFAAKAMQELINNDEVPTMRESVEAAYRWADAMLEARKK